MVRLENKEPTSGLKNRLSLLQLRVCGQWLLNVAGVCKSRIGKGITVPALPTIAGCCVRVRVKLGSLGVRSAITSFRDLQ